MANSKQAKKRARQSEARRRHNASQRSMMRTYMKKLLQAIEEKDLPSAQTLFSQTVSLLDRLARKGLIHKNKAARHKSRFNAKIKALHPEAS